jgi:hypothetical protein
MSRDNTEEPKLTKQVAKKEGTKRTHKAQDNFGDQYKGFKKFRMKGFKDFDSRQINVIFFFSPDRYFIKKKK